MESTSVGIREFRENLTSYLFASRPVKITRHGETVGLYVPMRKRPSKEALETYLRNSQEVLDMLDASGVTEEELIADFEELRRKEREAKS
jgi:antitoxin (DNA-binding transcriptional repressor) of toxin-antitoxin stability system